MYQRYLMLFCLVFLVYYATAQSNDDQINISILIDYDQAEAHEFCGSHLGFFIYFIFNALGIGVLINYRLFDISQKLFNLRACTSATSCYFV